RRGGCACGAPYSRLAAQQPSGPQASPPATTSTCGRASQACWRKAPRISGDAELPVGDEERDGGDAQRRGRPLVVADRVGEAVARQQVADLVRGEPGLDAE